MSAASTSDVLRHVPPELLEEILLKLPIKSLLRFSTVSKSWLFMISESGFIQEHKRRGAVNGIERIVTVSSYDSLDLDTFVFGIRQTSSTVIYGPTHLICPIKGDLRRLRAFCDGLCLVEAENVRSDTEYSGVSEYLVRETVKSLHLWNPSTRTHRKLPDSLLPAMWTEFVFGLGYDSSADDYKVLKIAREESSPIPTQLYSLKSDSWKTISPPPPGIERLERCEYVNGSFHRIHTIGNTIVSFDLSTEKCWEMEIMFAGLAVDSKYVEVVVTRGKLCVSRASPGPKPGSGPEPAGAAGRTVRNGGTGTGTGPAKNPIRAGP